MHFHVFSYLLFILQLPPQAQRISCSTTIAIYREKCTGKNGRISGSEWEFVRLASVCCDTAGIFCRSSKLVDLVLHWCTKSFLRLGLSQQQRKILLFYHAASVLRKMLDLTFEQWEHRGSQPPQLHKFALPVVATQAKLQLRSAKQLPKDCGVNVCGPHLKCHLVLIQEKKYWNVLEVLWLFCEMQKRQKSIIETV